jgi:predicted  nucleic acid-binding Zn-ribbon protein
MMTRDEYVKKLKSQIDQWNTQMTTWEAAAKGAQSQLAGQLEQLKQRRDQALEEMRRLQGASTDAWKDMMRGAEDAFRGMQEAFDKARRNFDKKK